MNVLILSCGTGGGHNSAAKAVEEELTRRGHRTVMMDPFSLAGDSVARIVGNVYIRLVQKSPGTFGLIYLLGLIVTKLPCRSPVYYVHRLMVPYLEDYLKEHSFDAIVMSHLFPAEMLTQLKRRGFPLPPLFFIGTDYACIPFTEETECDYYIVPHREMVPVYADRGVAEEKLVPLGIPVAYSYTHPVGKAEARRRLGLSQKRRIYLVAGGSIGAGKVKRFVNRLAGGVKKKEYIIVICGNNQKLGESLKKKYRNQSNIRILGSTEHMSLYMEACDVLFSKPGGLSSTEAAVLGTPLIHISEIPGCETLNRHFFVSHGMSLSRRTMAKQVEAGKRLLASPRRIHRMQECQKKTIPPFAAEHICSLIERQEDIYRETVRQ